MCAYDIKLMGGLTIWAKHDCRCHRYRISVIDKISAKNILSNINNASNLIALFFILFNMYLSLFK